MIDADVDTLETTDPELISRVREGDVAAYGTLFRRHVDAATRLARLLVNGSDADDLVSEAFVKVLNVLLGGGGPDVAFRAYLLTAVRRLHVDRIRSNQRLTTTDDLTPYDPGVPFVDPAVTGFEGGAAAKAFASLPERWQLVLWHLEVENQKPADIAPLLGISANSVSALAYRAREGLRQAFLNMHSHDLVDDACRETNGMLGAYVRGGLSRRDSTRVEHHLDHCRGCTAVYLELSEVNSSLAALLGPIVLGTAAIGYLGAGTGAGLGVGAGVAALVGRGRDLVLSNAPVSAATALAAVGIAGVVAVTLSVTRTSPPPSTTEPPSSLTRLAPAGDADPVPGSAPTSSPAPSARSSQEARRRTTRTPASAATAPRTAAPTPSPPPAPVAAGPGASATDPQQGSGDGPGKQPGRTPGTQPGKQPGKPGTAPGTTPPSQGPVQTPGTDPTPDPDPTLPTEPPPPDPPGVAPDRGRDLDSTPAPGGRARVIVRVTGVPAGTPVRLQVTGVAGDYEEHGGSDCVRTGADMLCTATPQHPWFLFRTERPRTAVTLAFRVLVPEGFSDPDTGNNTATVTVSRQG